MCKEQYGNEQTCNLLTTFEETLSFDPRKFGPGVEIGLIFGHCTELRFASFLSGGFKRTSVHYQDESQMLLV